MSGSHSAGPVSTNDLIVMPSAGMPALFTRMSTGPVSSIIRATWSRSHTSATTGMRDAAFLLDLAAHLLRPVEVDVVDPQLGAGARHLDRDRPPDSPARAGDERGPARDEVRPVPDHVRPP